MKDVGLDECSSNSKMKPQNIFDSTNFCVKVILGFQDIFQCKDFMDRHFFSGLDQKHFQNQNHYCIQIFQTKQCLGLMVCHGTKSVWTKYL